MHGHVRMVLQRLGNEPGKVVPVDGERAAGRDARRVCRFQDKRIERAHLFFQDADCILQAVRPKRVRADELCELVGMVGRCLTDRSHFI